MSKPRRVDRRVWSLWAAVVAVSLAWPLVAVGLVASTLGAEARASTWAWIADRWVLVPLCGAFGAAATAWLVRGWFDRWLRPLGQLAEQAQVLLRTDAVPSIPPAAGAEARALAEVLNALVAQREELRRTMDERVREAAHDIELERRRLAALMAELAQSVVVCNLDGRILFYNGRARLQFRALSRSPDVAGGAELIGLGRSIYATFDRRLIRHALDHIRRRIERGAAQPSAQFVTSTASGQLLRVQMAPVRAVDGMPGAGADPLAGFILVVDNITREFEAGAAKDRLLHGLIERSRASLASMQAALDMLEYPDLEPPMRERFLGVIRDETRTLSQRIAQLTAEAGGGARPTHWPREEMLGEDFISVAVRQIGDLAGVPAQATEVDEALWLHVESFSLLQALCYLARRLADEFGVRVVHLRLMRDPGAPDKAHLDLMWPGGAISTETVMSWELDPMVLDGEPTGLSVREVVERHDGAFWFERERPRQRAFFRFLLPTVAPSQEQHAPPLLLPGDARPEFYDFDLFKTTVQTLSLDERPLTELAYTVFDTETTGLDPSGGDRIIQIGAVRIVNGRLLRHECFEQLVDPQRPIPAQGVAIHGIRPEMVRGQPSIEEVLPAFHAYARDTVLVAHNAAFDMRFLQLAEDKAGVAFDHPVLDTLLLSALVHPNQDSHALEAIAARLGVPVVGRHTALGDALVTAEILLRLIPLLLERGIRTIGQAREASQKTFYARLRY